MWPTPTPIPTGVPPSILPLDPASITATVSNGILQGWSWFDSQPIATIFWFLALVIIIYLGILSIRNHVEKL